MMFCIENKIFDILCASILTDRPEGFMKIGLGKLIKLLEAIDSPTTFATSSIKNPLQRLLDTIHNGLHSGISFI